MAYLQATNTLLPKSTANAVIIGYVASAVLAYAQSRRKTIAVPPRAAAAADATSQGQQPQAQFHSAASCVHYAQHILLCVGLITLVTYL